MAPAFPLLALGWYRETGQARVRVDMHDPLDDSFPLNALQPLDGLRLLVVDDLAAACETLALLLELEGAQVRTALDGARALVLAVEFRPHAVVLDLGLPDIDGLQLARRLRELPHLRQVALLALSGYSLGTGPWQQGQDLFDACWVKPADTGEMVRFLARRTLRDEPREK